MPVARSRTNSDLSRDFNNLSDSTLRSHLSLPNGVDGVQKATTIASLHNGNTINQNLETDISDHDGNDLNLLFENRSSIQRKPMFHTPAPAAPLTSETKTNGFSSYHPLSVEYTEDLEESNQIIEANVDAGVKSSVKPSSKSPIKDPEVTPRPSQGRNRAISTSQVTMEHHIRTNNDSSCQELPEALDIVIYDFFVSLDEPKYSRPLQPNDVSELFQSFYILFREKSLDYLKSVSVTTSLSCSNLSTTSPSKIVGRLRGNSAASNSNVGMPMESFEEMVQRKRNRSNREILVQNYLELAEKEICEKIYDKIFWLSNTRYDREYNEYLDSRIEALNTIGISTEQLDILDFSTQKLLSLLKPLSKYFTDLDESHNPREKLQNLIYMHHQLVEILKSSTSSSSPSSNADIILPSLIFCIVYFKSSNPFLNLLFIKRFRNEQKLEGEALYCLTNFEAALSFVGQISLQDLNLNESSLIEQGVSTSTINVLKTSRLIDFTCYTDDHLSSSNIPSAAADGRSNVGRGRRATSSPFNLGGLANSLVNGTVDSLNRPNNASFENTFKFLMGKLASSASLEKPSAVEKRGSSTSLSSTVSTKGSEETILGKHLISEVLSTTTGSSVGDSYDSESLLSVSSNNSGGSEISSTRLDSTVDSISLSKNSAQTTDTAPIATATNPNSTTFRQMLSFTRNMMTAPKATYIENITDEPSTSSLGAINSVGDALRSFRPASLSRSRSNSGNGMDLSSRGDRSLSYASSLSLTTNSPVNHSSLVTSSSSNDLVDLNKSGPNSTELNSNDKLTDNASISKNSESLTPTPIERFLTCTVDELTIGEISLLLEDYRRLSRHLQVSNQFDTTST
ncbi:hypothetical protein NADFUDRAFT_81660 [Nadsonia fulvescens var. elongata DSM 6958]|uniref:VPS9 domain-containing protein n=1 Tax=Nadsonia fulvescens var. elongata DSM 6958 TaxID=857566 RepID=A0A1E3PQ50_9ASCO|nr:hypothetical protein NADFUDRAFT_81660 [Nadsonia fulvescens var. elongata DSM 6958]